MQYTISLVVFSGYLWLAHIYRQRQRAKWAKNLAKFDPNLMSPVFAYCGVWNRPIFSRISRKYRKICQSYNYVISLNKRDVTDLCKMACKINKLDIVRYCLRNPQIDMKADGDIYIRFAAYYGHTEIMQLLLADGRGQPESAYCYSLRAASEQGHIEIVRLLLADPRINPAVNDNIAIRCAAQNGRLEVVKLLLADPRVDPMANDNEAIIRASEKGHFEIVRLLLSNPEIDPNVRQNMALQMATKNGHFEIVKLLLLDGRIHKSYYYYIHILATKNEHWNIREFMESEPKIAPWLLH